MSGGFVGQIIVRVLVGLISVATAFSANVCGPRQKLSLVDNAESSVVRQTYADSSDDLRAKLNQSNNVNNSSSIPNNPNVELPKKINSSVPNDAEVVSSKYAFTKDGKLKSLDTGKTVTDKKLVGTKDHPADPLELTNGVRFEPVKVSEVRKAIVQSNKSSAKDSAKDSVKDNAKDNNSASNNNRSSKEQELNSSNKPTVKNATFNEVLNQNISGTVRTASSVRNIAVYGNEYGAHWDTDDSGAVTFIDGYDNVFARNATAVIDVSEHQKRIDWEKVSASGVDGAIIRVSYGWDNGYDKQAKRNISECKRLGIPFGVYLYSYAETPEDGASEGVDLVKKLRGLGVKPSDLTYPVYYDLEKWSWSGHNPPNSPYVYQDIVASWWNQLVDAGYDNLGIYSYANYLKGPLNSSFIHDRTSWVASYGMRPGFDMTTPLIGWQYTSSGDIDGIDGRVDLNAFGMADGSVITSGPLMHFGRVSVQSSESNGTGWNISKNGRREVWSRGGDKFVLQYELRDAYYSHGGFNRLGAPVADEENLGGGWWRQKCQNGDVWTHGRNKKFVIQYELRGSYYDHGGESRLGVPVADEENIGGGWWRQKCQNGDVWTYGRDTKLAIMFNLRGSFYKHGGTPRLGAPVADEEDMGNGWWRQKCQNGDLWTRGSRDKFAILFNLRKDYYARGDFEKVGGPVEDEHYDGKGIWRQKCQNSVLEAR
ncbi:GH25 family lysozyme [Gardnerella vaginalis]|uniref:GH25 family lysozyme n=1 Tax=Gardnerella vaginalis TaxID=2702 RepID=UPI0039EE9E10